MDRPVVVDEVVPVGRRQVQRSHEEGGHLRPGHRLRGAEQGVVGRVASPGDADVGDVGDVFVVDGVADVEERGGGMDVDDVRRDPGGTPPAVGGGLGAVGDKPEPQQAVKVGPAGEIHSLEEHPAGLIGDLHLPARIGEGAQAVGDLEMDPLARGKAHLGGTPLVEQKLPVLLDVEARPNLFMGGDPPPLAP